MLTSLCFWIFCSCHCSYDQARYSSPDRLPLISAVLKLENFGCSQSRVKPPSPLSSVQKEGTSHRCSPAMLIQFPDSSTILIWHVSGPPVICLLLERMWCLKKMCPLKGFLFIRNQIKQKKQTKLQHFVMALFLSYRQIYLLHRMCWCS